MTADARTSLAILRDIKATLDDLCRKLGRPDAIVPVDGIDGEGDR